MRRGELFKKFAASALAVCMAVSILSNAGVDASAAETKDDEWEKIQSIVSRYYGEWNDGTFSGAVSDFTPDTALLGNGDIGANSGGSNAEKTFYISKGNFLDYNGTTTAIAAGGYTIKRPGSVNLAPNYKTVTVSSEQTWDNPNFGKEAAVSGTLKQLADGYGWCSVDMGAAKDPQWLQLEYDDEITVQKYELYNDGAVRASGEENNTRDFEFQYSNNGVEWKTADTVTGNEENVYSKVLDRPVTAKYFRIYITDPVQPSVTANIRARIGQLELFASSEATPEIYEKQDILNAEVLTDFTVNEEQLSMRTYVAADKNIVITEMTAEGKHEVPLIAEVWAKADNSKYPTTAILNEDNSVTVTRASHVSPGSTGKETSKIALTSTLLGVPYTSEVDNNSKGYISFTLQPDKPVYLVTAVAGGGKTYDTAGNLQTEEPEQEAAKILQTVNNENDIEELEKVHQEWWKDFWCASYIDFGTGDADLNSIQKYYYGAQYILGCTSREGKAAPGIMGVWTTTDTPMWQNRYQLNYNYNATFYGTNSSNRPELGLPGFEEMLLFMPEGLRRSASIDELRRIDAEYVNSRLAEGTLTEEGIPGGLLYPCALSPGGVLCYDSYQKEPMYAAYSSYPGTQYYQFTKDEKFLEEKLYDYLKACAVFYETWLEKDENGQYNIYAAHNEESWSYNAAVELGAAYSLFKNLVDASITLDKDADKRELWIDIRDHLAPQPTAIYNGKMVYTLAEKTRVNGEYVDLPNPVPGDGNALPLEALQQGERLGYFSTPEELQIAANTIDTFGEGVWSQRNNFPRIYTMAVRSRYPITTIIPAFAKVINDSMQKNLRIKDPSHGVEKVGATEAVNNMLMLTDQGITKVFPNWLPDRDASFVRLRAEGAFLISSEYDASLRSAKYVEIESEKGGEFTLVKPWNSDVVVTDSKGEQIETTESSVENWPDEKTITFNTTEGETYIVTPKEGIPEKVYLSSEKIELKTGATTQLEAFTTNGSEISMWESDNTEVARVTDDGKITAVSDGQANIKAGISAENYATCKVTVTQNHVSLFVGEKYDLNEFIPVGADDIKWESDNTEIVEVTEDGIVRARCSGSANITAVIGDITFGLCKIEVTDNTVEIHKGRTADLSILAEDLENVEDWKSSDNEVAVVGKNGIVTALSEGETVISVRDGDWEIQLCRVSVTPVNEGGNVALQGRAYASDSANGFAPDRAICGGAIDPKYEGWVTNPMPYDEPRWWAVELPEVYTISRWVVTHDGHRDNPIFNTKDYVLQYSQDGENWIDADLVEGNTEDQTDRMLSEPITAKYFRIYITAPEQQKTEASTRGRIRQVELYAEPDVIEELYVNGIEGFEDIEVEKGISFDDLDLPESASVELSNQVYGNIPVEWEAGDFDGNMAGTYTLKGILDLPEQILNPSEISAVIRVRVSESEGEAVGKKTLEYFLNKAKEHQANGDVDNCVESIKNLFTEAIKEGEAVMADENATYDEVMNATVKLMKAIQALDMKAADKTDLEMAVELAEGIDLADYVEAGQAEFQQALADAQAVLTDGDAMQPEADAAWNALVDAIGNLRLKADKSTLEDWLNSVENLDLSRYTEESAAVFRTALANAQAVMADESLSEDDQKTVDDAVQALNDAKDQLQLKDGSAGEGGEDAGNGEGNDNTGVGSDNTGNDNSNTGNGDSQTPGSGESGNSNAKADAPKTGDAEVPFGMMGLAIIAGGVSVISFRKKSR